MEIFLVRHGQSTGNDSGCFLGWTDHPLTELGRAQSEAVAARLAPLGPMPVICSDLRRARMTAEIIAARWGGAVEPDLRWRELHCGDYEGRKWDEFSHDLALGARFEADPFAAVMPGGESAAMMAERVMEAFAEARNRPEKCIAIVTHDGPIRAVLCQAMRIAPEGIWTFATDHGGFTRITITDGRLTVRTMNDTSHLEHLASQPSLDLK